MIGFDIYGLEEIFKVARFTVSMGLSIWLLGDPYQENEVSLRFSGIALEVINHFRRFAVSVVILEQVWAVLKKDAQTGTTIAVPLKPNANSSSLPSLFCVRHIR